MEDMEDLLEGYMEWEQVIKWLGQIWIWTGIRTRSTSLSLDIKWQRQQIPINKTWLPLWPWKYWNGLWVSTSFIKCRCESGKHPETTLLWVWTSLLVMGWWFGVLHIISWSEFKLVLQTRLDVIVTEVKYINLFSHKLMLCFLYQYLPLGGIYLINPVSQTCVLPSRELKRKQA